MNGIIFIGDYMQKLGNYEIPGLNVDEAISATKLLEKVLMGKEAPKASFAKALGQSPKSGAFFVKMADLKRYGLINGRGEAYQTTDLAKRISYETDPQKYQELVREVAFNIPLYKAIYDHFKDVEPTAIQFEISLAQITGEHPESIKKCCEDLRKIYNSIPRNIAMQSVPSSLSPTVQQPVATHQQDISGTSYVVNDDTFSIMDEGISIKVKKDEEHIQTALDLLEVYKTKVQKAKQKKEDPPA
jgi:hypothetical protein